MSLKHILYIVFPFVTGFVAKNIILKNTDTSYWVFVGVLCLISMFLYSKIITPYIENQYGTYDSLQKTNNLFSKYGIQEIDMSDSVSTFNEEEKQKQKHLKSFGYISLFHMLFLIGLIIFYFIK